MDFSDSQLQHYFTQFEMFRIHIICMVHVHDFFFFTNDVYKNCVLIKHYCTSGSLLYEVLSNTFQLLTLLIF